MYQPQQWKKSMEWIMRGFALLVTLFVVGITYGEEISTKEPRWKQLSQAYGYVLGQQTSLELIEQKFPDLSKDVNDAWFSFNSTALGKSAEGVEKELAKLLGDKWPQYQEMMAAQIDTLIKGQDFTRKEAVTFLEEVRHRAKGEIPSPILATLLSANPRYSRSPGLELAEGWKHTYRTKGHPKAKGVDFSVSFPASWSKREGERPNVIQVFQNNFGHGPIMGMLMVKNLPLPQGYKPTKSELKEFFQPTELKSLVPDSGTFVDAKTIALEGAPAGMLISDQVMQRLDITLPMRMIQFITIEGRSMIFIQFLISKMPGSKESLDELQRQYLPAFRLIANTFVLNDKYK